MAQLSKALGKVGIDGVRNRENYLDQRGHISFPIYVRRLFEEMGVTYIKLGQLIGSSPTLFPDEYVQDFRKCFDKAPPISYEQVRNIIQQDLAQPIHKIFPIFDRVPIATASVAQVHAANLQDGTRVAVKVRKPGVDLIIKTDLKFLWIASKILETLNPAISPLSLSHMVKDLRESMIDELDFRKELNNIDNFRTFIERNQITDVTAPKTFEDLSSERVLTMEYLDGISLSRFLEESSDSSAVETVLFSVLRTWARTINRNDRFHADLHAGNILVLPGNKVGFVDFGIGEYFYFDDTGWEMLI
jgi:aarF domain-containing kinase